MTYSDICKHFGTPSKAAAALAVSRQAVHNWKKRGIALSAQFRIQVMTRGRLKANTAGLRKS